MYNVMAHTDPVISRVMEMVMSREKMHTDACPTLTPYKRRFDELVAEEGILMWGYRVIIPTKLRPTILQELHEAHPGITRMKALARSYFWWPGIDNDIEAIVGSCESCQQHQNMPESAPMHMWEPASKPWSRLHLDHAGPFQNKLYLIVADAYSKWVEAVPVSSTNSTVTIEKLKMIFATHGLPEIVVADNASGFKSEEFGDFLQKNNIRKLHSAPFHPATNGLAERNVQTFKNALKKMLETNVSKDSIQTLISRFLFTYRITPHSVTGISPAEALMKRKLNNVFNMLKPCPDRKARMMAAKDQKGNKKMRFFNIGEVVWIRNYANGPKWIKGVVERLKGPASYEILVKGNMVHRHVDQVRRSVENETDEQTFIKKDAIGLKDPYVGKEDTKIPDEPISIEAPDVVEEPEAAEETVIAEEPEVPDDPVMPATPDDVEIPAAASPRRSSRLRNIPRYLSDYITWLWTS